MLEREAKVDPTAIVCLAIDMKIRENTLYSCRYDM